MEIIIRRLKKQPTRTFSHYNYAKNNSSSSSSSSNNNNNEIANNDKEEYNGLFSYYYRHSLTRAF
jgi:hypothetical protein